MYNRELEYKLLKHNTKIGQAKCERGWLATLSIPPGSAPAPWYHPLGIFGRNRARLVIHAHAQLVGAASLKLSRSVKRTLEVQSSGQERSRGSVKRSSQILGGQDS